MSTIQEAPACAGTPSLMIRVPLEGRPEVWADVMTESEGARLTDWMLSQPQLEALLTQALGLAGRPA